MGIAQQTDLVALSNQKQMPSTYLKTTVSKLVVGVLRHW